MNLSSLNPQQRLAVETIKGPVLILAGAGTGKTRVITFRIAHMVSRGINPGNILAVTFTNKAAREMQERVRELVPRRKNENGEKEERPTICTFHSLCVRILRRHIELLGYKRNFVIYNESDQLGAMKKVLSNISAKGEKLDPRAILSTLSRFKNGGARAANLTDQNSIAFAQHIEQRYQQALHACNAVDFDDLILLALKLFKEHPAALEACRDKYRYVMVDEYQDTNGAQFELVHALTQNHRNFCVVGDDDQSIYGWRGAEIANLLDLEKHYPEVKIAKLEQNYRSTNTILKAANAVIKHNARRRGKQLWSDKGQGAKVTLHAFGTDEEEARVIVEEIEYSRMTQRIPWVDQAILFRTNIQSRAIEIALRKSSVRYHLIGGQSFFDRREVKDVLSYLKLFLNPNDEISLLRIANVPPRGLTDMTMERLLAASQERKCSVYAAMTNPVVQSTFLSRTREAIETFIELLGRQRQPLVVNPQINLTDWAQNLLTEIGYYEDLRRGEKDPETAGNRIENVKEMLSALNEAGNASSTALEKIEAYLDDITLDSERAEEKERTGDAVTLITMHSCKGLEFPHVYVVGVEEGLLPHSRSKLEGTLDEERRLFYVAITRAMKTLTISHCETRKKFGDVIACHPSQFLKELPEELVEHGDVKAKQPVAVNTGKSLFAGMRAAIG
ncbi:MAG TPA: UvrD-helicase domain-containing protein [Verrucomicrobiae bacterium]|nr:UvrD-helicase domain-containing protein [Verrucomicrobiae bacterium]